MRNVIFGSFELYPALPNSDNSAHLMMRIPPDRNIQKASAEVSPWVDVPLLKPLLQWLLKEKPLLVAEVKPGIEWALRPRAKEGREFKLRLMTKAGVMVCARGLRRGQARPFGDRTLGPLGSDRDSGRGSIRSLRLEAFGARKVTTEDLESLEMAGGIV